MGEKKKKGNAEEHTVPRQTLLVIMSSSMAAEILNFVSQYTFYSGCILFIFGVIGNAINILVFTQLKLFRNNRCAFYLTVESIANFLSQFITISSSILISIYGDDATGRSLIWCRFRYILGQSFALITAYMICLAAIDQFFSTNYYFHLRSICTLKLARCLTYTFVCIWIIHSLVFGYFSNIQPLAGCVILNKIYLRYATFFFYPILGSLLPIAITSFFALLAFRNVRRLVRRQLPIVRRRLDRQMTAMVFIRVIVLICLAAPYSIYRIYIINFPITQTNPKAYATKVLIQAILFSIVSLNYTVKLFSYVINFYDIFICSRSVFMSL